jgi:anti-sigma B factor antagonist
MESSRYPRRSASGHGRKRPFARYAVWQAAKGLIMSVDPDVPPAWLSVTAQRDGVVVRLVAAGEIDMSTADVLRESLSRALHTRPAAVVVDMADVTLLDSTGITALVQARNHAIGDGATITLINCRPIVHRVLEVTGLLGPLAGEQ